MFDTAQLEMACRVLEALEQPLELRLNPGPDRSDVFSRALYRVAEQLVLAGGSKLKLVEVDPGPESDARPSLTVGHVRYCAVPFGPELEPFLELLVALSRAEGPPPGEQLAPASLQVMMAPTCPNCPRVVAACAQVVASRPQVGLEVVDVQYFRELAGNVKSVPTVIIDGARTVVGALGSAELLELLRERSSAGYVQSSLSSMIENGRFADAVPLLTSAPGCIALAVLMKQGTMQERIGLLLAVEEALAADPHALDSALPHVLPLAEEADANLRGDAADLLGRIGAPGARDALTTLLSDDNPDVRDVAADALEMLRQPS
ncbi:MAG: thioredoxin family protein [bacterium]